MTEFSLDLVENPHPRMLAGAIAAQRAAGEAAARIFFGSDDADDRAAVAYWDGYLAAMVDATGCERGEMLAWVARGERS